MRTKSSPNRMSAAEKRFNGVMRRVKGVKAADGLSRSQEEDIAHIVNDIQRYGFNFMPNHYIFDKVDMIENVLNSKNK